MAKVTVAVLARPEVKEHQDRIAIFRQLAPDSIDLKIVDASLSEGELIEQLAATDGVIPWRTRVPPALADAPGRLKLVQLLTAGFDAVDMDAFGRAGIAVANNGGSNAISVSEHTVSLMLAVYRRLMDAWANARAGNWRAGVDELPFRREINGKTVGIVGFGNIGRQVARRLQGWDADLLYHDVMELPPGRDLELDVRSVPLDDLLSSSDIVTLHMPLDPGTDGMIGARELALMKPIAILINTCRGPVVDEDALIDALSSGTIAGAGLDVLVNEPPSHDNPLLSMDNVVVTPHWAGGTLEGGERATRFALSNFERLAEGRPLLSVIRPSGT